MNVKTLPKGKILVIESTDDIVSVLVNKQNPIIIEAFRKVIQSLCRFKNFEVVDDGDFWKVTPR